MSDPSSFPVPEVPAGRKGRGDSRDSMMLAAVMRRDDRAGEITLRVRNVSEGGVMADCPIDIERGTCVTVELRAVGEVAGVIAWARDGRIGIAFERQIDPRRVRRPVGGAKPQGYVAPVVHTRRPAIRIV